MAFLIIANPVSGGKKGKRRLPEILRMLDKEKFDYELIQTEYHGHAQDIIKEADVEAYDTIVIIGGDGTNFFVLNGLLKYHADKTLPAVAIIPTGSGDAFALDLGLNTYSDGVKALVKNKSRYVDILCFTSKDKVHYCANMVGTGFVTRVASIANKLKFFRGLSYVAGVLFEMIFLKFHEIELTVNNQIISGKKCFVEFCNSKYTGRKMLMAPGAKIDDGLFDIVIASTFSRFTLLKAFPKIFKGSHVRLDQVTTIRADHAVLKTAEKELMLPDGEVFGETPTEIKLLPKKICYFYLK